MVVSTSFHESPSQPITRLGEGTYVAAKVDAPARPSAIAVEYAIIVAETVELVVVVLSRSNVRQTRQLK